MEETEQESRSRTPRRKHWGATGTNTRIMMIKQTFKLKLAGYNISVDSYTHESEAAYCSIIFKNISLSIST